MNRWEWVRHSLKRYGAIIVVTTLLGLVAGAAIATTQHRYQATAVLSVRSGADIGQTSYAVLTAASTITGATVVGNAARALNMTPGELAARVTATPQLGTTLIDVEATADTAAAAIAEAEAIATAAIDDYRTRSATSAEAVRAAGELQVTSGRLTSVTAEDARLGAIGTQVGTAQGAAIAEAGTLVVRSAATTSRAGVSLTTGALFGAAAGLLLALMICLARSGSGRRRVRDTADLTLLPDVDPANVFGSVEAAGGEVLEGAHACVLVVECGSSSSEPAAVTRRLRTFLERNGARVGCVLVGEGAVGELDTARGVSPELEVLSRASRTQLPEELLADIVLLQVSSTHPSLDLVAGQADYTAVIAVAPGTRADAVTDVMAGLSAPLLVMSGR